MLRAQRRVDPGSQVWVDGAAEPEPAGGGGDAARDGVGQLGAARGVGSLEEGHPRAAGVHVARMGRRQREMRGELRPASAAAAQPPSHAES